MLVITDWILWIGSSLVHWAALFISGFLAYTNLPALVVTLLQVHVHIKRHVMRDLPETDEAVAQWCKDIFVAKVTTI